MNTQQWWGCTRVIVRVLWSQGDREREEQQVAKEGVDDTQKSEEKCTCWLCGSSGRMWWNIGQKGPDSESETITFQCKMIWGTLERITLPDPACQLFPLASKSVPWEYCFCSMFLIFMRFFAQGAKTGRRWHRGKLQVKLGVQWIKQVKWVVFTFGLCKAFNTHMLIGIGSLIRGKQQLSKWPEHTSYFSLCNLS